MLSALPTQTPTSRSVESCRRFESELYAFVESAYPNLLPSIKEKREPNASLAQVLPCMHVLGKLEKIIDPQRKAHA